MEKEWYQYGLLVLQFLFVEKGTSPTVAYIVKISTRTCNEDSGKSICEEIKNTKINSAVKMYTRK